MTAYAHDTVAYTNFDPIANVAMAFADTIQTLSIKKNASPREMKEAARLFNTAAEYDLISPEQFTTPEELKEAFQLFSMSIAHNMITREQVVKGFYHLHAIGNHLTRRGYSEAMEMCQEFTRDTNALLDQNQHLKI